MSLLVLFLIFAKIAMLTFGGGYAMVPLFEHEIVTRHAFMSAADFANLIGLAQVTPGPIGFNSATYVGMAQGGFAGSVIASLGVMVPSIVISLIVAIFLRKAADAKWMKLLMKGVRPCVVGIIGAAVIFFAKTAICWQGAVIFALVVFIRWKWAKLNPIWSLAVSAFLGWALFFGVRPIIKIRHTMNNFAEKTLHTERKYTGKIVSVDLLDIELPDGRKAKREVIRHGNSVAILARRPDGRFVFVKQYRKAAEEALIEVIAGGLEAGEDPIEGAKRETAEETGYEVTSIKFLTTIICTPGYCEERIHIYFAELSETAHGQDQDPDENVYPVILSEAEVEDGIRNGTIFDAKTLAAWACYKLR